MQTKLKVNPIAAADSGGAWLAASVWRCYSWCEPQELALKQRLRKMNRLGMQFLAKVKKKKSEGIERAEGKQLGGSSSAGKSHWKEMTWGVILIGQLVLRCFMKGVCCMVSSRCLLTLRSSCVSGNFTSRKEVLSGDGHRVGSFTVLTRLVTCNSGHLAFNRALVPEDALLPIIQWDSLCLFYYHTCFLLQDGFPARLR